MRHEIGGIGFHEVIIETLVHNRVILFMKDAKVEAMLSAYQRSYRVVCDDPVVK